MIVRYRGGRKFEIEHRQHRVMTDQTLEDHGEDSTLTPSELFVGALAACTALYVSSVASRHGLAREDVTIDAEWHQAAGERRLDVISMIVRVGHPAAPEVLQALRRAAEECLLHNTLATTPLLDIEVVTMAGVPGGEGGTNPLNREPTAV